MKKQVLILIKKIADASATRANGVASEFSTYQPKTVKKTVK